MKLLLTTLILALFPLVLNAGTPPDSGTGLPVFDKLKTLAGKWTGKDEEGNSVTLSYTIVSSGTALMESMDAGDKHVAMITMYHPDRNSVMLTHYCSMGNQPRMKADGFSNDGKSIDFTYVDATNLPTPDSDHMHGLVVTFKDNDHFSQSWTLMKDGKAEHHALFEFERVP